jgi:hypothetical protein
MVPPVQEVTPTLHGFVDVQVAPGVQPAVPPQVPFMQTMPPPQLMPSATLPASMQVMVPPAHEVTPALHGFDGVQVIPGVQPAVPPHVPFMQTIPPPQLMPSA